MNRERLTKQLIEDEDIRLKVYKCPAGKLTIGIGRNLEDRGISEKEAMYLCDNDIDGCIMDLTARFDWFVDLSDARQEVLLNMCFNLGISRLLMFEKMIEAIEMDDYEKAADEMVDSAWYRQVGERAKRLEQMMRRG